MVHTHGVEGSTPPLATLDEYPSYGILAQLGEHLPYKQRVIGSSPIVPTTFGPVVQLVRTLACHARGQGFESPSGRHFFCRRSGYASVAQLVEQGTENPRVVGSIPTGGTNSGTNVPADENRIVSTRCGFSSFGRARPCQGRGGGFEPRNPLQRTQRCNSVTKKPCPLFIGAIAKR